MKHFAPARNPTPVQEAILLPLARLRLRAKLYVALDGATRTFVAIVLGGAAQLILDRWLKFTVDQRAIFNVFLTFIWLTVAYRRILLPMFHPLDDETLARAIDRRHPALADQIATAVQFSRPGADHGGSSPELVEAVIADASRRAREIRFLDVLNHRRARRQLYRCSGLLVLPLVGLLLVPDAMQTWFHRNWLLQELPWPQATYIRPQGYDAAGRRRVPRGDPLEIAADIIGETPDRVTLEWWTPEGRVGRETMLLIGDSSARIALGPAAESVHFRITGGDERTAEYVAEAIDRPDVLATRIRVESPAYTGLEPVTLDGQTTIEALAGSRIEIEADLNKPVRTARFASPAGAIDCELTAPNRARLTWNSPASGSYVFELVDRDGWENRRTTRYLVKISPDEPPSVKLSLGDIGGAITPQALLPIEAGYSDSYGLSRVGLWVQRNEDPPLETPIAGFEAGRREMRFEMPYEVSALGLTPGQRLRVFADAADGDPAGPNVGRSEPIDLRVLAPADLQAELTQRELELRLEFERLISEQNGLRDALERIFAELSPGGPTPPAEGQRLAGLARRQEAHAARVAAIERGFTRILAESKLNRISKLGEERRLTERIIGPLGDLAARRMPAAVDAIGQLRREADAAVVRRLAADEAEIVRTMKTILANMLEMEGFREAVALLTEIIEAQGEVHGATVESLSKQIEAIIGLDELPTAPTSRPKP